MPRPRSDIRFPLSLSLVATNSNVLNKKIHRKVLPRTLICASIRAILHRCRRTSNRVDVYLFHCSFKTVNLSTVHPLVLHRRHLLHRTELRWTMATSQDQQAIHHQPSIHWLTTSTCHPLVIIIITITINILRPTGNFPIPTRTVWDHSNRQVPHRLGQQLHGRRSWGFRRFFDFSVQVSFVFFCFPSLSFIWYSKNILIKKSTVNHMISFYCSLQSSGEYLHTMSPSMEIDTCLDIRVTLVSVKFSSIPPLHL